MNFCTTVNCMDGRIQLPVIEFLKARFNVEYVDSITEAGPNLILSERRDNSQVQSIINRINISVNKHNSVGIAVVGHYDCAGNPSDEEKQYSQIKKSIEFIRSNFKGIEIIGLWVNNNWNVEEIQ